MAPPSKSTERRKRTSSKERESGDELSTLNLWVGDLSPDTVDFDLMAVFGEYGAMDALTSYSPRTYAFVFFKNTEDAKKAKEALQGSVVRGSAIKVEFARLAKPGRHIWIGGISSSVTAEQLEDELSQFGKIDDYKFFRDRNSALVGYSKLDNAIDAQKNINGKSIGGEQVRVDFQKPQSSRRDWPDNYNSRGTRRNTGLQEAWLAPDEMRNHHDGSKRHLAHGSRRDGPPSSTLWVGYPPSVHMDEQMLHNAMILFGEIERIKSFPSRNYSFVEFRSVDEARRAKEGLQGRLFGDPRIQIMFSSSDLAPGGKDNAPLLPGYRAPRPDMIFNEAPFGPIEIFAPNRPMAPNSFPGHFLPKGPGPSMSIRSHSTQGFDPHQSDSDFNDFGGSFPNFSDGNPNAPNWRQLSPVPGMRSSMGMRPPPRPMPNMWDDGFDVREPKRSRIDGSPVNDAPFHGRRMGGEGMVDMFGRLHPEREIPGQSPFVRGHRGHGSPDIDHCWRGVIAKAGSPVCHARCVPIGGGLESPLPEVVNCYARTDLDMLTTHYAEAIGFDIVFFLPDSEEDFASYTEFLQYLGLKNRVGVAKCDDGTPLFLVPPSDFLTRVLKVSGPERLYGVVLKLPHQSTAELQQPQAAPLPVPHYSEQRQEPVSQDGYDYMPTNDDRAARMDYGSSLHENSISQGGVGQSQYFSLPSTSRDYEGNTEAASQVEVSLTPELIATLASLIPSSSQPSITGSYSMSLSSSTTSSSLPANMTTAPPVPAQGWIQEHQATFSVSRLEPRGNTQQQFVGQYNTQAPFTAQYPTYANLSNGPDNSVQTVLGGSQVQDLHLKMPPQGQSDNYEPSHGQSLLARNQHYQHDTSFDSYNAHEILQATDAVGMLNQPFQQSVPASSSTLGQTANMLQNQTGQNADFSAQMQQIQMALNGPGDGTSQGDAEKNQRYQSTLQFAASLLQKIQQQQQGSGQAVGGTGNQQ